MKTALLAEQFPSLDFAKKADEWLASIGSKTIEKQLTERRVKTIFFKMLPRKPKKKRILGGLIQIGDLFFIEINKRYARETAKTLGHEIAHTFEDKRYFPFFGVSSADDFPKFIVDMVWALYRLIEQFCDKFAKRWLAINGRMKVHRFLKRAAPCWKNDVVQP